jgi:hypothetical protein
VTTTADMSGRRRTSGEWFVLGMTPTDVYEQWESR